jgi:hypothetical protein
VAENLGTNQAQAALERPDKDNAIRAKTFEECVTSLQKEHDATGGINAQRALKEAIEVIRALAQTDGASRQPSDQEG